MDPPPPAPRKVRFVPKAPPPRKTPSACAVTEDGDDEAVSPNFSRRFHEHLKKEKLKQENKYTAQDSFSLGVESNTIRTFGKGKEKIEGTSDEVMLQETDEDMQVLATYVSTAGTGGGEISPGLTDHALTVKKKKGKYNPVDLPLRMPNTGNPELLDAAEFTDAPVYDENSVSAASQLDLVDQDDDAPKLIFLQLPINLSFGSSRPSGFSKGKEIAGSSTNHKHGKNRNCSLEDLPAGQMGKMLVYKSGAVKWKIGDILYDVSPGVECKFSQNLVAINTTNKQCCNLGELDKRAVITPDIDSLLDSKRAVITPDIDSLLDSIIDLG